MIRDALTNKHSRSLVERARDFFHNLRGISVICTEGGGLEDVWSGPLRPFTSCADSSDLIDAATKLLLPFQVEFFPIVHVPLCGLAVPEPQMRLIIGIRVVEGLIDAYTNVRPLQNAIVPLIIPFKDVPHLIIFIFIVNDDNILKVVGYDPNGNLNTYINTTFLETEFTKEINKRLFADVSPSQIEQLPFESGSVDLAWGVKYFEIGRGVNNNIEGRTGCGHCAPCGMLIATLFVGVYANARKFGTNAFYKTIEFFEEVLKIMAKSGVMQRSEIFRAFNNYAAGCVQVPRPVVEGSFAVRHWDAEWLYNRTRGATAEFLTGTYKGSALHHPTTFGGLFLPEGFGKLELPGGTYIGDFSEGSPHGYGVLVFPDGTEIDGFFDSGKLVTNLEKAKSHGFVPTPEHRSGEGGGGGGDDFLRTALPIAIMP